MSTQKNVTQSYSIREASKITGLPSSTLRYYESIGIIEPIERGETSKHRAFSQRDIDVLDTIACLNATGMALDDMRSYIANLSDNETHVDDQVALLKRQKERLDVEERHIQLRREYVDLKILYWDAVKNRNEKRIHSIATQAKELAKDLKKV
jgi:DNA-binding transcriptional MerR regulator